MTDLLTAKMTAEAFDEFVELPENAEKILEFIADELYEVPSNAYSSEIGQNVAFFIKLFLRLNSIPGHVTGESGGFNVNGERYAPDVGYISVARQFKLSRRGYNEFPPELAVEVDYPSTRESVRSLRVKIANYLAVGTVVWIVDPELQTVEIYAPGQNVIVLGIDGTLNGGSVLPGFTLSVADVFKIDE